MKETLTYSGTSVRGLTKEIEIPVPWGIIAGKILGDSTNPPVLCIHGWLDNCNTFDNLIPLLPADKYYVFIDLPGHGLSSDFPPGMFYTTFDYAALVYRLANYFEWKVFSFIGHSLGAVIGAMFAGSFPEKVDKLILLDEVGFFPINVGNEIKQFRSSVVDYYQHESYDKPSKTYSYQDAKKRLLNANPSLTGETVDVLLERGARRLKNGMYEYRRDRRHRYQELYAVYAGNVLDFLTRIAAETIHIIADNGDLKNKEPNLTELFNSYFRDGFNNCEYYGYIEVKGKHHVHLCHPERVIHPMTSLLQRPLRPGLRSGSLISKL
ncbi:serine hydrolase-like protein [Clavelina lepadiformis]|uniref:serine hydrolase-like protein n=1 Tax=Clavelina lepadiformis TaxID=159417 RepID=UPI004042E5AC